VEYCNVLLSDPESTPERKGFRLALSSTLPIYSQNTSVLFYTLKEKYSSQKIISLFGPLGVYMDSSY